MVLALKSQAFARRVAERRPPPLEIAEMAQLCFGIVPVETGIPALCPKLLCDDGQGFWLAYK